MMRSCVWRGQEQDGIQRQYERPPLNKTLGVFREDKEAPSCHLKDGEVSRSLIGLSQIKKQDSLDLAIRDHFYHQLSSFSGVLDIEAGLQLAGT